MHKDKYAFAQLVEFLDNNKFRRLVEKYNGDFHIRHFSCWNQLLALMFGQLSGRESLRDLIVTLGRIGRNATIWALDAARSQRPPLPTRTRGATTVSSRISRSS